MQLLALVLLFFLHSAGHAGEYPLLIDSEWLAHRLKVVDFIITDTRDRQAYLKGHIPGAINIPVEDTYTQTGKEKRLAGPSQIRALFSKHGLSHDDRIVLYDSGNMLDAARFFWVLEVYGHRHISLLDGGLDAWMLAGRTLEKQANTRRSKTYIPTLDSSKLVTKKGMQLAINDTEIAIIDSRPRNEYEGKESISSRAGHIPGAINIPWTNNLATRGGLSFLLNNQALDGQYTRFRNKNIVTYCNYGKQSSLTYLVLRHLGYAVSIYEGAWQEWGNDPILPVE